MPQTAELSHRPAAAISAITAFSTHPRSQRARVLVLGDSTGVGLGAQRPQDSLCGLLAQAFPQVAIDNRSTSGARVADALRHAGAARQAGAPVDLALLLVGGNDVLAGTPRRQLQAQARQLLHQLRSVARHTVWLGCANIGASPLFVPPWSWCLAWHTRRTMRLLAAEAQRSGAAFIDFARRSPQNPFGRDTSLYFADDGVHPSNASYRHCFDVLMRQVPLASLLGGDGVAEPVDAVDAADAADAVVAVPAVAVPAAMTTAAAAGTQRRWR